MSRRFNFRNPSYRQRLLFVGIAFALPGVLAGAVLSVMIGYPLLCVMIGGLVGLGAGAWLETR